MRKGPLLLASSVFGLAALGGLATRAKGASDLPALLSQTGLLLKDGKPANPSIRAYAPQYPLWSDGAEKHRWVLLPEGGRIDTSDTDRWDFPVGTKFWKEFDFNGQKVETRLLWKTGSKQWTYATYHWRADGSDADLAPAEGLKDVVPLGEGKAHSLPSVQDCKTCHENGRAEVLGFSALQLSTLRDPLAPHAEPLQPGMVTLKTLNDEGRFAPARPEWTLLPPRTSSPTARTRAVLGYFHSNCGSCHQAEGPNTKLALNFRYPVATTLETDAPAWKTAVDVRGKWGIPGQPSESLRRIAPGHPELSTVAFRMGVRRGVMGMPHVGTVKVDEEATALVKAWIQEDLAPKK
jgi:mono/diheme cytochrome c family protein